MQQWSNSILSWKDEMQPISNLKSVWSIWYNQIFGEKIINVHSIGVGNYCWSNSQFGEFRSVNQKREDSPKLVAWNERENAEIQETSVNQQGPFQVTKEKRQQNISFAKLSKTANFKNNSRTHYSLIFLYNEDESLSGIVLFAALCFIFCWVVWHQAKPRRCWPQKRLEEAGWDAESWRGDKSLPQVCEGSY